MSFNARHVDRLTRQWVRREHLEALGEQLVCDLEAVLVHHRQTNLAGFAFDAAAYFGLPLVQQEALAMAAELLYCAFGLVDDIQDGDADAYLERPRKLQLNVALALRELGSLRLAAGIISERGILEAHRHISATALRMTRSQHEELTAKAAGYKAPWNVAAYERVARLAAGAEVALLLGTVGLAVDADGAAGVRNEPITPQLRAVGLDCGVLLQILVDSADDDERITSLPRDAVDDLQRRYAAELKQHSEGLPAGLVVMLARASGAGDEHADDNGGGDLSRGSGR